MKDSERLKLIESKLDLLLKRIPAVCDHEIVETIVEGRRHAECAKCGEVFS